MGGFSEKEAVQGEKPAGAGWNAALFIAVFILCGELALRLAVDQLPLDLANHLFTCFESPIASARFYYTSPELEMNLMRPHYEAECYRNGHRWRHETDGWGFRNPETWDQVDVALVGDSVIYGIGVEQPEIVSARLSDETGLKVANFGRIGASPVHYSAITKNFVLPLKPRVVVVFGFYNDLTEARSALSAEQMTAFVRTGASPQARVYPREQLLKAAAAGPQTSLWDRLLERALVLRTAGFYWKRWPAPSEAHAQGGDANARALQYTRAVLHDLTSAAKAANAVLVLSYLRNISWGTDEADALLLPVYEEVAAEFGLPFYDAGRAFLKSDGSRLEGIGLENDGHLTSFAHERLAEDLAGFLEAQGILP